MKTAFKKYAHHLVAILVFLLFICIYFAPGLFEGKTIQQDDMQNVAGASTELVDYYQKEDGRSAWTGSMFSGMPAYHIGIQGNPPNFLTYLEKPLKAIDYMGASMILVALVCFYILMCVIGVKHWLAIAGSIAFAFSSYNFIIVAVGHITKMYVIAYMPLTVAAMILLFRRNWIWGSILLVLGISFSVMNSHIQITYYLALFSVLFFIGLAINEIKKKDYTFLAKITGIMVIAVVLSIIPTLDNLYANYEIGQESLRGPSELSSNETDAEKQTSTGLDIDYAFSWSYGKGELLTLLIPNVYGGASGEVLDKDSEFYKAAKSMGVKVGNTIQAPTYWGDQPFTSGPVYLGSIVCFLFILGLIVIKNPVKWWVAGATLFFIFLALGRNFNLLNEFLFHHLPMYNKFRTPSTALVIPALTFSFIGFWGLKQIIENKMNLSELKKPLIISLAVTGGICLLIWIVPGLFLGFESPSDAQQIPEQLMPALISDRESMASSDALRSLVFILLAAGLLFYFLTSKNKKTGEWVLGVGLMVLVTFDMWGVDKRYLNNDSFSKKKLSEIYKKSAADEQILKDTSPSYRVLNLSVSTFNESGTANFHKSIGGYSAAKLRRYQELVDHRVLKEINTITSASQNVKTLEDLQGLQEIFQQTPTLNMLNAKYIIYNPNQAPLINKYADGNAWFVHDVQLVKNADQEIEALNKINPLTTAVVDERFAESVPKSALTADSTASIRLTEYKPDRLKYESNTASEQIAIFSEIYYKSGWKAFIDGKSAEHYRADWVLRAMNVPAGKHTIEFRFEPDTYYSLARIGSIASLIMVLGFICATAYEIFFKRTKTDIQP
ncbi:membrane protein [Bacteroidia bacterium]|nr:membrane protein [Bacteroidia bacterium]